MKLYRIILPLLIVPAIAWADEPQEITLDWLDRAAKIMTRDLYLNEPDKFEGFSRALCHYTQDYIKLHNLQKSVYIEAVSEETGEIYIPRLNFIDDVRCGGDGSAIQYRQTDFNVWRRTDALSLFGLSTIAAKEIRNLRDEAKDEQHNAALNRWASRLCQLSSHPIKRITKCGGMDDGRCLVLDKLIGSEPRYLIGCCIISTENFKFYELDDGWNQHPAYDGGDQGKFGYRGIVNGDIESATATLDMFDENCQPIIPAETDPQQRQNPVQKFIQKLQRNKAESDA